MSSPSRSENSDIEQLTDEEENEAFAISVPGTAPAKSSTPTLTGARSEAAPTSRSRSPSIEILTDDEEEESDVGEISFRPLISVVNNDVLASFV